MLITAVCQTVKRNNGIVQVLLTRKATDKSQEDHVLINLHDPGGEFQEGKTYWIEVKPTGPQR